MGLSLSLACLPPLEVRPSSVAPDPAVGKWTGWISLLSKGLSRVFSNITIQKHQFFSTQLSRSEEHTSELQSQTSISYGYESWTIKKAEHQRIEAFELWCQRRLLRVPWTTRRPNQFILKEISPEYSLEGTLAGQGRAWGAKPERK